MGRLDKRYLIKYYIEEKKSAAEVARFFECSEHKVNYWIKKYNIQKRSISEAVYAKCNPDGDPFSVQKPHDIKSAILYGLGLGLYWGEGTKKDKYTIRLANTDPQLIKKFLEFLENVYGVDRRKIRFWLLVFSDMSPETALKFWQEELGVHPDQFFKVTVTPRRGIGTYRTKTKYGVLTVHFGNKKLRDIICGEIENF